MGRSIRKAAQTQLEPFAPSGLIHQYVRAAIETAVHEELRAKLGTTRYERSHLGSS
jgi:hypothetical protein